METRRMRFGVVLLLVVLLALSVRLIGRVKAQELEPPEEVRSQDEVHLMTVVPGAIGIQGRLTNASGTPLNGSYSITFRLYDVESDGTSLCADTNTVNVENGLFNSYIDYCYDDLWGQKVWLGVKVGTDAEMEPRQVIYPVPYALTLKPGAVISGTADPVLTALASGSGDDDAFLAVADGTGEAVQAEATGGVGVAAFSDSFLAIQAYSYNTATYPALFGCAASSNGTCDPQRDDNPAGVMGYSSNEGGDGVHGETNAIAGRGVYGTNSAGGIAVAGYSNSVTTVGHLYPTLYLVQG
ncbi:MAG: hypothetical protein RBT47_12635, partial [Anaerolineae bacterium]|nr:hypothetical protein [Anaerolineae bacterium]